MNAKLHCYETRVDLFDPPICAHALPDNARAYINYASDRPRVLSLSLPLSLPRSLFSPFILFLSLSCPGSFISNLSKTRREARGMIEARRK